MSVLHLSCAKAASDCNTGDRGFDNNTYTFYKQGEKFVLNPLEAGPHPEHKREVMLEES